MKILKVKQQDNGYLVNNTISVMVVDGSYEYELIKQWIAEGNIPEPEFTEEELEAQATVQAIAEYKASRQEAVNNIKVTTEAGNTFDGDETSQTRMVRAASLMDDVEVTNWVLADNTVIEVSKAELMEAAKLAGQEQTRLWIKE